MCPVVKSGYAIKFQRRVIFIALIGYLFVFAVIEIQSKSIRAHNLKINNYYGMRESWKTSNLGSILFKNTPYNTFTQKNRTFVILVWKYWNWLQKRHVYNFNMNKSPESIFKGCSVSNCYFIGNDSEIDKADVVLVHLLQGVIPKVEKRNKSQLWIFLADESPVNVFSTSKIKPNLTTWANVFNWSMNYRTESDVPVPYGRTVPLLKSLGDNESHEAIAKLIPYLHLKQGEVLVASVMSHCISHRMKFFDNLRQYINIDLYGTCSQQGCCARKCPGHFKADCPDLHKYYFYLVIENSKCSQYITEKIFRNAYSKGAIPILVGPSLKDSDTLLPPNSYIHWADYLSHKELANSIIDAYENKDTYTSYHLWRNDFEILNEHGFLGTRSYHLCRLCEALNYNDEEEKSYTFEDLLPFLDPKVACNKTSFLYEIDQVR